MLDIREILRRLQLGQGERELSRDLTVSRKTITKYRRWAEAEGLLSKPLPDAAGLQARLVTSGLHRAPPRTPFAAEPYRERIEALRQQGVECRAILERLREEVGFTGSYSGLWRYVRSLEPTTPEAFLRIETASLIQIEELLSGIGVSLIRDRDGAR